MGIKEDDLIKYLDAFMSGNGGSIKPIINEAGDITYITADETAEAKAANEDLRKMESDLQHALFNADVDDECPTCANIPNICEDDFGDFW